MSRPAYGLKGDFQFVEARMDQIVNFLVIEKENAIEIANQFFRELLGKRFLPAREVIWDFWENLFHFLSLFECQFSRNSKTIKYNIVRIK